MLLPQKNEIIRLEVIAVVYKQNTDRAKQFASFDALKGYREALLEKERIRTPKKLLSEDRLAELDQILCRLQPGDQIKICYFSQDTYVEQTGVLTRIDSFKKYIKLDETSISFSDILDIAPSFY